jgi:hypothetical protein
MADTHPSVTERDIHLGYQLLLGRSPENSEVVERWLSRLKTWQEMRRAFIHSPEFLQKISKELGFEPKPLDLPAMDVEVDVSDDVLSSILKLSDGNWEIAEIGGKRAKKLYNEHVNLVSSVLNTAVRAGVDYGELNLCYQLDRGVRRQFSEVPPTVSQPHLRAVAEAAQNGTETNVDSRLVSSFEKIAELPEFDCFVSSNALQYNPPPVIVFLLRTVLGKLRRGGLAYFQILTYKKGARFRAQEYLASGSTRGKEETYVLPQAAVWRIADKADCQVLDVREDGRIGGPVVSNAILLRKRNSTSAPIVQLRS